MRISILLAILLFAGCAPAGSTTDFRSALTFFASFDDGFDADFAVGDAALYYAPSLRTIADARPATAADTLVRLEAGGRDGDSGQALQFSSNWDPFVFYRANQNVDYRTSDWSGTFSLWLRIDPDRDLKPGYSDPFLVSDKNWDDASLYIDFTKDDTPRHFRFAAFADKSIWNPNNVGWDDLPFADRPMIDLDQPLFASDRWTHVAFTFEGYNNGDNAGRLVGYIDGERVGVLEGRRQTITWTPEQAFMALGRHYTGGLDELAIFNRALSDDEVRTLYTMPAGEMTRP